MSSVPEIPESLAREIDDYETELELRRLGRIDERLFSEARLRRGVYGQRYDNGRRHDGARERPISYPSGSLTKGPGTFWDAPGMQRIKIPFGSLAAEQLEILADCADDYSLGVLHVTTRQDFQLHFVHIEDTPGLMRRLAAVGITTREACGNTVRNVTSCPLSGVCRTEAFDVGPYARALAYYLLGHPDASDFGRKFKIAFSGCKDEPCGLTSFHDLGFIAKTRDGERGFELYVGGGLGTVPSRARLFESFLPEDELLPTSRAICRVFARLGEKKNRARARLKFLVNSLGIEEFRRLVLEERRNLPDDRSPLANLRSGISLPLNERTATPRPSTGAPGPGYEEFLRTNVYFQRQEGFAFVLLTLPLGDLSSRQARVAARAARRFGNGSLRTTVDQNLAIPFVASAELPAIYEELAEAGLGEPGAATIVDVTACPGTDTCKLGIASSRGLAGELRTRLAEKSLAHDEALKNLRIKVSGCFNSCGQHHVADLGFYGVSRSVDGRAVPHFQVVLGGEWSRNAAAFGLAIGAVPSKRIPEVVLRLTDRYRELARSGETFREFVSREGKSRIREMLSDLMEVPAHAHDPTLYSDWGDPREFGIGDLGKGECAGEVVSKIDFALAASERQVFEAQLLLEQGKNAEAVQRAFDAMLGAADGLVRLESPDTAREPDAVVEAFRQRFYDTELFFDPYAGGKFAHYFFGAHRAGHEIVDADRAHQRIEEAQLFVEAAHGCRRRWLERRGRES